ncbi:hypothetical protein ACFS27_05025 [Promicromonospora vindobonensis]|uniref:Uncharacterized protein n=1 Tax=Promicromonospora vindobonensis TaxID=195748 RepID=A0ABW5VRQ5_9MICO
MYSKREREPSDTDGAVVGPDVVVLRHAATELARRGADDAVARFRRAIRMRDVADVTRGST